MNKFKTAFAVLAVLVILAAPAYATPVMTGGNAGLSSPQAGARHSSFVEGTEFAAKFGETLYAERQT